MNDKAVEVIDRIFTFFFSKNEICLEITIKGSYFNFYCNDLLHNKCFQQAPAIALNHKETGKISQRNQKLNLFIDFCEEKQIEKRKKM